MNVSEYGSSTHFSGEEMNRFMISEVCVCGVLQTQGADLIWWGAVDSASEMTQTERLHPD